MKTSLLSTLVLSLTLLSHPALASASASTETQIDAAAYQYCGYARADSDAEELANEAICLVGQLSPYFNLDQQARYLMPIKKAAGRLKATSYSRGSFSSILRIRLNALRTSLGQARGFAERNMEVEAVFDLMVDVVALEERLAAAME